MRKIIHSKFEIDLSNLKITDLEQNSNFSDTLFVKTSYPFEIDLTDEMNISLDFIREYTTRPETIYDVLYCHHNRLEKAVFEIEEIPDGKLSCVLQFGFEQFPSWDKQLSELSLDKFALPNGTTIYQHANTIVPQTWPNVNYNFPQIHTDKIDTEDEVWSAFEKIINNRKLGVFTENSVDIVEDITYNRNIVQPLPYLLYVIKKGIEDANFTLHGDILQDVKLKKRLIYADTEYYTTATQNSISVFIMSEDATFSAPNKATYYKSINIPAPGKYRIIGQIHLFTQSLISDNNILQIKYRNVVLYQFGISGVAEVLLNNHFTKDVNVVFETLVDLNPNEIVITSVQRHTLDQVIVQLDINPIRLHDNTGTAIPTILNLNEINLPKAVPQMTYGDLINRVKNWFNYGFYVVGSQVFMNKINDEVNNGELISFEEFQIKNPLRQFQKGMSFLLKFTEIENKDFQFLPVFQNASTVLNADYIVDDKTNTIEIDALPLPLLFRGVQTAYALENNSSKLYLVKYDGLFQNKNLCQDNSDIHLPVIHIENWYEWFKRQIFGITFKWSFITHSIHVAGLSVKNKLYCYQNRHLIKTIQKTEVLPDVFQVEIETQAG